MSEELKNNEISKVDDEKFEKIRKSLDNLINKKSKILFCIPESENPAASVYEIYFHATVLKKAGYDVIALVEKDINKPTWIEDNLTDIKHISMSDPKLTVGPEDIMIIPEVYSNVMEQTKNLPCLRIGFLQSIDYMFNALIPGSDWSSFGVNDIITVSKTIEELVNDYFNGKFNIHSYNIGIPEYFKRENKLQKPIISIIGRNPNEISKLVKLFFAKYPQYNWISFDPMLTKSKPPKMMRRIDFANRLKENFAAVWIDRISSFGTFPLECMKAGVIPICFKPDINPEYIVERNENGQAFKYVDNCGIWTDNYYDIPKIIADTLIKFLDDNIGEDVYANMEKIASKYTQENSEKELLVIYENIINNRIKLFEKALEENK